MLHQFINDTILNEDNINLFKHYLKFSIVVALGIFLSNIYLKFYKIRPFLYVLRNFAILERE